MKSSTLSHILASSVPVRSPRISAMYGSPDFFGFTCFDTTTKLDVMTLFSWWQQSEMKKSFTEPPRTLQGRVKARAGRASSGDCDNDNLKHSQFFLFLERLRRCFLRVGLHRLGLLGACTRVHVSGLDIDESLFPQLR